MPALSVVMTAAPILHLGVRPIVVECTPEGTGFDLDDLAASTGPCTRAIVHPRSSSASLGIAASPAAMYVIANPAIDHN